MLEDKASRVRKSAVGLLGGLVVTHPYGLMHGGLLGLAEWEERSVKAELEKVEGGGVWLLKEGGRRLILKMRVRVPQRRNPGGGFFDLWNFVQCLRCYRKTRVKTEDGMDVDGDETEDAGDTNVSSAASSDVEMDSKSGDTSTKNKKKMSSPASRS
jgi:hypothetical protein